MSAANERAGILSDKINVTSDSEELLVLSAIYYIIEEDFKFIQNFFKKLGLPTKTLVEAMQPVLVKKELKYGEES